MGTLLAVIAVVAYGASDFVAGVASRRASAVSVTAATLVIEFLANLLALAFFHGARPAAAPLIWGAISGIGSAVGTLALNRGFAVGRMSVVATLLRVLFGVIAGAAFALLFIALDRDGIGSGAWPLVVRQIVACAMIARLAMRGLRADGPPRGSAMVLPIVAEHRRCRGIVVSARDGLRSARDRGRPHIDVSSGHRSTSANPPTRELGPPSCPRAHHVCRCCGDRWDRLIS